MGRVDYHKENRGQPGGLVVGWLKGWGFQFLSLLVLGAALLGLARPWADQVVETMSRQVGLSALMGVLGLVLIPMVSVLLFVTAIGLPVGLLLMAIYGGALLLANVFVAYLLGGWVLQRSGHPQAKSFTRLALGALILSCCTALPWVGWIVLSIALVVGLGAFLIREWDIFARLRTGMLA